MNVPAATLARLPAHRAAPWGGAMMRVVLGAALSFGMTGVHALGLGEIVEQSALGEPLRFAIPVLVNAEDVASDDLAPECVKLVPGESVRSGELPQIAFGRAMLERNAAGVRVVVTSNVIARDPALSFTVQVGCRLKLRHEYTVLLDPPIIQEPAAQAESQQSRPQSILSAPAPARSSTSDAGRTSARTAVRAKGSARGDAGQRATRVPTPVKPNSPAKPAASSTSKDANPRLTVSRSAQDPLSGSAMTDIARGKSDEEIRREVEAETLVLQRRIDELSATLQRMEVELREATAARESAERTAKAAQPQPERSGLDPWLISFLFGLIALALAAMLVRIRQASRPTLPPFARADAASGDTPTAVGTSDDATLRSLGRALMASPAPPSYSEVEAERAVDEDSFDEDLLRYAEQASAYTALEREHPKVIASVVREWSNPKVITYLRDILVNPRKGARPFSKEAVSDLIFLQGLAMEHAGYRSDDSPWQIELDDRRRA